MEEQSACDYVITVTDVATEKEYPAKRSSEVMAKVIFMQIIMSFDLCLKYLHQKFYTVRRVLS